MDGATQTLIVGQIVTFLLALVGFGVSLYRESRNRKWDLEDRARARNDLNIRLTDNFKTTHEKIEENTQVSKDALHEANDAKNLIASIEQERNKLQAATISIAANIKDGTEEVADAVDKIQDNTTRSAEALTKLSQGPIPTILADRRSKK